MCVRCQCLGYLGRSEMSSFEQACAEAKQLAEGAVQAGTRLVQAARELAKAADEGDLAKVRRATEKLRTTAR
jgi:hypothetical protein